MIKSREEICNKNTWGSWENNPAGSMHTFRPGKPKPHLALKISTKTWLFLARTRRVMMIAQLAQSMKSRWLRRPRRRLPCARSPCSATPWATSWPTRADAIQQRPRPRLLTRKIPPHSPRFRTGQLRHSHPPTSQLWRKRGTVTRSWACSHTNTRTNKKRKPPSWNKLENGLSFKFRLKAPQWHTMKGKSVIGTSL